MVTRKKTVKKSAAKVAHKPATTPSKSKVTPMRSFAPARATEPFFTFRITHQTLYWTILAVLVLALGLWVISINDKVQRIYDQIDASNAAVSEMTLSAKR